MDNSSNNSRSSLTRSLGPGSIWAVALGSIIGWGCFIQSGNWTIRAGGPLPLMLGIMTGALLMIVIGYSYSYMITRFPVAGGEFAYSYQGFGTTASFICGWMLSLGYISLVALNATALPVLASYLFPGVFNVGYLYTISGYDVYAGEVLISIFFIIVFGIMNYRGVKKVGKLQLIMVVIMCCAILTAVGGTIASGSIDLKHLTPAYGHDNISFIAGYMCTLAVSPYLYVGFDCIPQSAEEYNFPPSRSRKLIVSALIVGGLIYMAMAFITDSVIPWTSLSGLTEPGGAPARWLTGSVLEIAMGKFGVYVVGIAVCMAIFTGMNGFFMTSSRLMFSIARAKMLPSFFAKLHPAHNTPGSCIIFAMLVCCICPFFGREVISWVVDMCSVGTAFGYIFTCASAYKLLKKSDIKNDSNRISPNIALAGCIISVGILLLLITPGSPAFMVIQSWVALGAWVLIGIIFYMVSRKKFIHIPKRDMDKLILGDSHNNISK